MTQTSFSLSHLSALDLTPPQLVSVAAEAGYWAVGLRLNPAAPGTVSYPLRPGTAAMAETLQRMDDTGVAVYDVEFIPLTPTIDIPGHAAMFEAASALGAQRVNVSGDDPDVSRLTSSFAGICELAASFGLDVDLEFMRWRHVGTLAQAAEIVRGSGAHNGAILLDVLHLFRSGGQPSDVRGLEPGLIRSVQLCDAPAASPPPEGIVEEARKYRIAPGAGELPLADLLASLPGEVAFGVEVPLPPDGSRTPHVHARRIREAAERLLESTLHHRDTGPPTPAVVGSIK
jgi:sugar phosphate isomerase/epimerase